MADQPKTAADVLGFVKEHVGEPEPDEADVVLLDEAQYVSGGLRLIGHAVP